MDDMSKPKPITEPHEHLRLLGSYLFNSVASSEWPVFMSTPPAAKIVHTIAEEVVQFYDTDLPKSGEHEWPLNNIRAQYVLNVWITARDEAMAYEFGQKRRHNGREDATKYVQLCSNLEAHFDAVSKQTLEALYVPLYRVIDPMLHQYHDLITEYLATVNVMLTHWKYYYDKEAALK